MRKIAPEPFSYAIAAQCRSDSPSALCWRLSSVTPCKSTTEMLACLTITASALVVGPVLRPTASLLASHRHAPPCAVDRVDRATAVRVGAAAVVAAATGGVAGCAP